MCKASMHRRRKLHLIPSGKQKGWDYYISGGDDERTLRENANVFQRLWLKPRILRNVTEIDMSCDLLGTSQTRVFAAELGPVVSC